MPWYTSMEASTIRGYTNGACIAERISKLKIIRRSFDFGPIQKTVRRANRSWNIDADYDIVCENEIPKYGIAGTPDVLVLRANLLRVDRELRLHDRSEDAESYSISRSGVPRNLPVTLVLHIE